MLFPNPTTTSHTDYISLNNNTITGKISFTSTYGTTYRNASIIGNDIVGNVEITSVDTVKISDNKFINGTGTAIQLGNNATRVNITDNFIGVSYSRAVSHNASALYECNIDGLQFANNTYAPISIANMSFATVRNITAANDSSFMQYYNVTMATHNNGDTIISQNIKMGKGQNGLL